MSLSVEEKQNLKSFLVNVYGPQANNWKMSDEIFNLTYQMLSESGKCSDVMDLVPRPLAVGQNPTKWLTTQVRSMILRKLKDRKGHYAICVKTSALKFKTSFIMADTGL
ncbi:hypothetical protein JKP28_20485 [Vibrio vulnificus]|uniref:hypothetical protein n=1 Tax=Vibrio vulnificus TaxID=672 RepID=UPI0010292DF1|nr:hypothetical protein [Vibrio vulnificus]ELK8311092.1 hypothetical protein [Vibrio vulnificus]ELK8311748.1 hypothetical protein [Vibrio vulnificus]ELL0583441.1 hypothetical protein [Vibrio vulnificus]ELL0587760.1 hypothetical protein [Vibrio vulnificus]ELV8592277.1 hypothetical protein [Vibrio vulnificus]